MKQLSPEQNIIADDILRYKKNKLASSLALLGLVFSCLYFLILYAMPRSEFFTFSIGASVLLTLIVLLVVFLSSEGVKGYNKKFSIVLIVCAAFQILRIFYYPLKGITDNLFVSSDSLHTVGYFGYYPEGSSFFFTMMVIYLVLSAACFIGSAVWGWIVAVKLEKFQKKLDNGEVDVMAAIRKVDAEEEAAINSATNEVKEVQ